jgi:hypothetical protein
MRQAHITVREHQGAVELIYKGKNMPYQLFEKKNKPTDVVTSKQLNTVIDQALDRIKLMTFYNLADGSVRETTLQQVA